MWKLSFEVKLKVQAACGVASGTLSIQTLCAMPQAAFTKRLALTFSSA
jgi:hypothetical protein